MFHICFTYCIHSHITSIFEPGRSRGLPTSAQAPGWSHSWEYQITEIHWWGSRPSKKAIWNCAKVKTCQNILESFQNHIFLHERSWKFELSQLKIFLPPSATQGFFSPAVSCAVVSAPRHIAVFVHFHPRGFHFGFLQKPGDGGIRSGNLQRPLFR